jgi:hypothetical protein
LLTIWVDVCSLGDSLIVLLNTTHFFMANSFTKHLLLALTGTALLSSCSRQYAVMQRTPSVNYHSPVTASVAPVATKPVVNQLVETTPAGLRESEITPEPVVAVTPTVTIQTVRQQLDETVAANNNTVSGNRTMTKRVARVQQLLASAEQQAALTPTTAAAPTKKMGFAERMMFKKINARINKQMAPDKTNALDRTTRIGLIVALIGLVLLLVATGTLSTIGLVALVVGLVLVVVGLINRA